MEKRITSQALQKIAQNHNVSVETVRTEIQNAIQCAFPNNETGNLTPEEFVTFICQIVCSYSSEG